MTQRHDLRSKTEERSCVLNTFVTPGSNFLGIFLSNRANWLVFACVSLLLFRVLSCFLMPDARANCLRDTVASRDPRTR